MLRVEVVWALPEAQFLRAVELPSGSTVRDAITASGVERECAIEAHTLQVGIWSKRVGFDTPVAAGDRIELYRPLKIDPKQARRLRAQRRR